MVHCDLALALRLEREAAAQAGDYVTAHRAAFPASQAALVECAGGVAAFIDEASPLTQVRGAGTTSPILEADVETVEQFYEPLLAPVSFVLAPFADAALFTILSRRGYELGAFENVMVREVAMEPEDAEVVEDADAEEWARAMAQAFFDVAAPGGMELGRTLYALRSGRNLIVRAGEQPAAVAQLDIRGDLAIFQCDGTLRRFREVGLQKKTIRARMALASAAGCTLVTADVQPGSVSQRNYEKCGFQVAYTKVTLIKPCF